MSVLIGGTRWGAALFHVLDFIMKNAAGFRLPLFLLLLAVGLCFLDLAPKGHRGSPNHSLALHRVRARVLAVDNSHVRTNLIIRTEEQFLTIRLTSGPHKGTELDAVNYLSGKMEMDEWYEPGQLILAEYQMREGRPIDAQPRGIYRLHFQVLLIALFAFLLLLLAGWTGLGAILSFIVSALMLWKLFFPLLLRGWPPLPTGLVLVALLTALITLAVGGLHRRGWSAFAGSMLGVLLTCGLTVIFARAFHVNGAVRPFAETLLYSGFYELRLTDIFIASVFIASSGAVMDLAMDIATAMDEIKHQNPQIKVIEHGLAGLRVGRAVIGTMTTTLLLAYTGSHITMFMLFMAKGLPLANIFNTQLVSAEIMNILVGSFGLVTVAPLTAIIAAVAMRSKH
jgi:uncharacterized membrane protein